MAPDTIRYLAAAGGLVTFVWSAFSSHRPWLPFCTRVRTFEWGVLAAALGMLVGWSIAVYVLAQAIRGR